MDIINRYINEDLPYVDLTTSLQNFADIKAILEIYTRDTSIMSGGEFAKQIAIKFNCKSEFIAKDGEMINANSLIFKANGSYENIHKIWKLIQNLLEYMIAIATYCRKMLNEIRKVNNYCQILGTRKTFPNAKEFCIKALIDGGGMIHRLNLSDSILFFENHRILYEDDSKFYEFLSDVKLKFIEKKLVVEALSIEDAINLLKICDCVQLDKMSLDDTQNILKLRDEKYKNVKIISAGGINLQNIKEYAKVGVDGIVTSAMYYNVKDDLKARILKI
ncbi:ModD protein [Campylobacter sp. RM12327]|uniref:ModD protein n=1 Tax=Campylobacter sputorum TaxID=206 RepID=UPI000B7799B9|nr:MULTISPECIES: ModD protein [Campylobacter]ASM39613.1 quinolinate phosphoribosyltransferase-like protein [Campylobacter sputorum]MBE7358315.1 ModD protein [Campylobacter sp. RM11302]MBF6669477.1 ModD protein [Campylobacter sp. RM12327]MBF6674780.1 ModD protein [Campylobacter sp. RM13538]MBF6676612.1 ModD protein [Campylobacter sp. RM12321]